MTMKNAASNPPTPPHPLQRNRQGWWGRPPGGVSCNRKHCESVMRFIALLICGGFSFTLPAQDQLFDVVDEVALPAELGGGSGSGRYLKLHDRWSFIPEKPALLKENVSLQVRETVEGDSDLEVLQQQLAARIGQLPVIRGEAVVGEVDYEFSLLDPHLPETGMHGFPEPDSMDRSTREFQAALIELTRGRIRNIHRYDLEEQLLSVYFHELWSFDPASGALLRQVTGITPVIWQRRRTVEGEPVNEAGTGWPVYYKNELTRIDLRNP